MAERDAEAVASEEELGQKWDRCIADAILKTGTGFGLGLVFSLLIFKRRPWPMALGTGFGLGYAMSNCQHDFRRVKSLYLRPIPPVSTAEAPAPTAATTPALPTAVPAPPTAVSAPPTATPAPPTAATPLAPTAVSEKDPK